MAHESTLKLPLSVISPSDLKKLSRELDNLSDTLLQMEIREGGKVQVKLPKTSQQLDDLTELNKINLLHKHERENLSHLLARLTEKAPVMHMSFSSEPSLTFMNKLIKYLRESFDPYILVAIGLSPSIGAGCMARTTNHFFDLSLKQALLSHKDVLLKDLAKGFQPVTPTKAEVATQ